MVARETRNRPASSARGVLASDSATIESTLNNYRPAGSVASYALPSMLRLMP